MKKKEKNMKGRILLFAYQLILYFALVPMQCRGQVWLLPIYLEGKVNETKLEFYGILKDQDGLPVSGAKVKYTLSYVGIVKPMYKEKQCLTNKDGRFEIHGGAVAQLIIDSFELVGYDFDGPGWLFEFQKTETKRHKADKTNPVEFRIRRRNPEAVHLQRVGLSLIIGTEGKRNYGNWAGYDISGYGELVPEQLEIRKKDPSSTPVSADFELTGKYDADNKAWTVTIRANGENAGFQFSEQALYEAPADGYVREMTMTYPVMQSEDARKAFPKYIYARVREPGFYMKAKVGTIFIDENRFALQAAGVLNPYGGRCLEKLEMTDYEETLRLDQAARSALFHNKFAEQPDFKQLIKEGKAKY